MDKALLASLSPAGKSVRTQLLYRIKLFFILISAWHYFGYWLAIF